MTPHRLTADRAETEVPANSAPEDHPRSPADHPNGPRFLSGQQQTMAAPPVLADPPGLEEATDGMELDAPALGRTTARLPQVPAPRLAAPPQPAVRTAAHGAYRRVVKPCSDRVGAAVGLVVLLPLLLVLTLAILLSMGRPVFFTQERVGQSGRRLNVVKFRTMRPDRRRRQESFTDIERRRTHKSDHDPRHTRLGRVLRRLSLDELPQLLNVVRGEMSLVGPRPELPEVVSRYRPWEHRRHEVRPGLTGLWQVTARGQGMMHEHVDLDVRYIETLSARTDLLILLRTLPVALGRRTGS
jgi:lipopolysaccharide/colanic/teichoic acid biosynthesis glycosyltransferase